MSPDYLLIISCISFLFMGVVMYSLGRQAFLLSHSTGIGKNTSSFNYYYLFAILFFAIMCGIRYRCGADCESYVSHYYDSVHGLPSYLREKEPIFRIYTDVLIFIGAGRVPFLTGIALAEISFFYLAFRSRNYLLPFLGLVLILGPHFHSWNNGLRQVTASCVFIFAFVRYIDDGKLWKFFMWLIIAVLVHRSAVILFPLFLLKDYRRMPRVYVSLLLLMISIFIGRQGILNAPLEQIDQFLSFINYDDYSENLESLWEQESMITSSFGPRRLSLIFSYVLIIVFSEKMAIYYQNDRLYKIAYLLFVFYACITEAVISHNTIFMRPSLYFMPFLLICSAYLLFFLKQNKKSFWFTIAIIVICSFVFVSSYATFSSPNETGLYKFIFLH